MLIRYVIGRPTVPAQPKVLKAGGVSKDARADTTQELYLRACESEQVEPCADYSAHLANRDLSAWQFRLDMFASADLVHAALTDALHAQNAIANAQNAEVPPRNAWNCERCRWKNYCEGDPLAQDVARWHDVEPAREATEIAVRYGRTKSTLRRDRPGYCCSPSELRAFMECPRLHWIEYLQRIRKRQEGTKSLPMLRGSIVHEAIQLATVQPGCNLRQEVQIMVAELATSGAISPEASAVLVDPLQVQALADRAKSMFDLGMEGVAEVIECEQRRAMVLPGTKKWLHGIPDAVVRMEDGRVAVIEYKTTSTGKDLTKVADRYRSSPQVHLYAALVQRGTLTL